MNAPEAPSIAVLVPVRDEERAIGRCLAAVLANTVPPDEVLVIDGGSTDSTRSIVASLAERDSRIILLENRDRTIPAALNLGWRATNCALIVRVDGHSVISENYLGVVRDVLSEGLWQGIGGRKVPESPTPTGRAIAAAMSSRWGVGNSRYHYARSAEDAEHVPFGAYPRAVVDALGGWDESLHVNQDFEFDHRLRGTGGRIRFDPAISSRWVCSGSLRDLAHQYHRYGRGKAAVALMHPQSVSLRHVIPPLLPIALFTLISAAVLRRSAIAHSALAAYLTAAGTSAFLGRARRLPRRERVRFPFVIVIMHNAWGLGFLHGLASHAFGLHEGDPYRPRTLKLDHAPTGRGA